ncbi:hypothetical protein Taro_022643 [Colocasia esculenta]|uniref:Uncharacterized protein n=1 Tax=Colocasia esculenta TaxID=4460 RepID=A0A843V241_COLES|nr:hypothetical protein [Colocasia esculenta]
MRTGGERQEPPQPQPQPTDLPRDPPGRGGAAGSARGKHQIVADMKRLEQETRSLEEELEELEKTDRVSVACLEYNSLG